MTKAITSPRCNWRPLAEQGDPVAQIRIGGLYADGDGVPRDYLEASKWFRRAAELGSARAQFNLGSLYYSGQGVAQNFTEAIKWYRLAAENGSADAQFKLGAIYVEDRRSGSVAEAT